MDDFNIDQTIHLWDIADGRKKVTLKNLASGKKYSFAVGKSFTVGRNEKVSGRNDTERLRGGFGGNFQN